MTSILYIVGAIPVAWNGLAIGYVEWSAALDRGVATSELVLLTLITAGIVLVVATECLNHTTMSIRCLRDQPDGELGRNELQQARDSLAVLAARREDADAQRDADWLWVRRPSG